MYICKKSIVMELSEIDIFKKKVKKNPFFFIPRNIFFFIFAMQIRRTPIHSPLRFCQRTFIDVSLLCTNFATL